MMRTSSNNSNSLGCCCCNHSSWQPTKVSPSQQGDGKLTLQFLQQNRMYHWTRQGQLSSAQSCSTIGLHLQLATQQHTARGTSAGASFRDQTAHAVKAIANRSCGFRILKPFFFSARNARLTCTNRQRFKANAILVLCVPNLGDGACACVCGCACACVCFPALMKLRQQ